MHLKQLAVLLICLVVFTASAPLAQVNNSSNNSKYKLTVFERDQMIGCLLAVSTNGSKLRIEIIPCFPESEGHEICRVRCVVVHYRTGRCRKVDENKHICVCSD